MIERNEMIVNAVKLGQCRKEIAARFDVTEHEISTICRGSGIRARRLIDEDKKREIAEYRNTHTLKATSQKFNISMINVSAYHEKYGDGVNIEEKPMNTVNVLKSVPNNFTAPKRGFGW